MQLPEGNAQMDGPEEATRESAWPADSTMPRKRGKSRNSAAIRAYPETIFRGQLHPGLFGLLHL